MSDFFNFNQDDAVFNNLMSDEQLASDITVNTSIDPPSKKRSDALDKSLQTSNNSLFESLAQRPAEFKGSAVKYVDPENVEKFKAQDGYDALNFNPFAYESNTDRAIANETWGTALAKGFDSMLYNAGNTYTSWFSDYGKMFDALAEGDWDALKPGEDELIKQYYEDQRNQNKNYVFATPEDEDGIFNKKFFSEFLGNVGFTYGTIAAIGTELAADAIITGLTGGAGAEVFGATLSRIGIKSAAREGVELAVKRNAFSRFAEGFSLADKATDAIDPIIRQATEAEITSTFRIPTATGRETFNSYMKMFSNNIFNIAKSKSATEFVGNVLKGTPLLGTGINFGEKIGIAAKAGAGLPELIGMGAQGFRRVAQELNMSISEASFEAVSSYGDTLDMLVKHYQDKNNGAMPDAQEFEKIREYALKASSSNYDTNTAILLATNKLQFGNLFNKFIPANKTLKALEETLTDRAVLAVGKKGAFKIFDKSGFFGTYGVVGKVASEFGKKEAAKVIGKSFLRNSLQFEVAEGLQEIYQEASASAWKKYFGEQYAGNVNYSLQDAFGTGFKEQWSKQGLKTFLTGALTGTLVKGPSKLLNNTVEKAQSTYYKSKYSANPEQNPYEQARQRLERDIETVNAVFKAGGPNAFSSKIVNFSAQVNANQQMTEAAAKGLVYEFENARDNALLSAVMAAYRTNTIDGFITAIQEMGENYSTEDFKKEFGIDIQDTKYNSPMEYSQKVAKDLKKYTELIEDLSRGVKNRFVDPTKYKADSVDRLIANHTRKAQEEAIYVLASNAIKSSMTIDRLKQLEQDLRTIPGLEMSSDYALRVLTNPVHLDSELSNLKSKIRQLEQTLNEGGLTTELRKITTSEHKAAVKELELLMEWQTMWKQRKEITKNEEDKDFVFAGIELDKKQRVKNEQGKSLWVAQKTWNPKHRKVSSLFRQILNLKNKQAGLDSLLRQTSLNDSFEKIVDYINLDRDGKDYLNAVEVLSDPDHYMSVVKRAEAGLFKYNLENGLLDTMKSVAGFALDLAKTNTDDQQEQLVLMQEIYTKVREAIVNLDAYNALLKIVTDPEIGIESHKEAYTLLEAVQKAIKLEVNKILKEYSPEQYKEDITPEEMAEIQKDGISEFRMIAIAEKIIDGVSLLPNEQKLYDNPAYTANINARVDSLKAIGYIPDVKVVNNEDGTADLVDGATNEKINPEPLDPAEAESLKETISKPVQPSTKKPAQTEELDVTPQIEEDDTVLDEQYKTLTVDQKINYLIKYFREIHPEYKKAKSDFGKGFITKERFLERLDAINKTIKHPAEPKFTLKYLLDYQKKNALGFNITADNKIEEPEEFKPVLYNPALNISEKDIDWVATGNLGLKKEDFGKILNITLFEIPAIDPRGYLLGQVFIKGTNASNSTIVILRPDFLNKPPDAPAKPAPKKVEPTSLDEDGDISAASVLAALIPNAEEEIDYTKQDREFLEKILNTTDDEVIIAAMTQLSADLKMYNKFNKADIKSIKDFSEEQPKAFNKLLEGFKQELESEQDDEVFTDEDGNVDGSIDAADVLAALNITEDEVEPEADNVEEIPDTDVGTIIKDFDDAKKNSNFVKKDEQSLLNDINDITGCSN